MTDWQGDLIAVDWGTTNRRAYAVDGAGIVRTQFEDDQGVLAISVDRFNAAVADIRARLGDAPMLLAGMIGSNQGWVEVPYVAIPAAPSNLVTALHWVADGLAIVPGLSRTGDHLDIMRGEEVQVFGALDAGLIGPAARACHPGTHAKWVTLHEGKLTDFRTSMTGEMFALLKQHSILQLKGVVSDDEAFRAGVDVALSGEPLLDALFGVRSHVVLGALAADHTASYASGLLIGADVAAHTAAADSIALLGRPDLCALYAAALERRGCATTTTDGAVAFVAGMHAIRKQMI